MDYFPFFLQIFDSKIFKIRVCKKTDLVKKSNKNAFFLQADFKNIELKKRVLYELNGMKINDIQ